MLSVSGIFHPWSDLPGINIIWMAQVSFKNHVRAWSAMNSACLEFRQVMRGWEVHRAGVLLILWYFRALIRDSSPPQKGSSAQRMWTNACCNPTPVRMGVPAPTAMGTTAVCVLMAGAEMTAVRTLMIVPSPPAPRAPPALTAWPPSLACVQRERRVRPTEDRAGEQGRGCVGEHSGLLPSSLPLDGSVISWVLFWKCILLAKVPWTFS